MVKRHLPLLAILSLFAALLGTTIGCSKRGGGRVFVLGLDGLDPSTIDLLMSEGKLPNFARLRQEGAYAPLKSRVPLLSPVIWTTIATGKTPDAHGIGHFVAQNRVTGEELPITSAMRKTKALWTIASEAGKKTATVGWWASWPAETIDGWVVSDHVGYHFLMEEKAGQGSEAGGLTHPPELEDEIRPFVRRPDQLTREEASKFVDVSANEFARPFSFEDDLGHFKWALTALTSYEAIGFHLWKKKRPDLELVYVEGTDSVSHLFGHLFRAGELAGELAEQKKRYGRAVEMMYLEADRLVGETIRRLDDQTTLVVLSDHGFELGQLPDDPSKLRDMRRVSEAFHRMQGVLYLYGRGVRKHASIESPTILDITPTVLTLLGLAPAKDMPGRVLGEVLDGVETLPAIATYESGGVRAEATPKGDPTVDPEILKKLQSLGYIGASSPKGDRNLAAVLFEQKRYEEAAAAYRKLVEANPADGALRASLAGTLGALGRYEEALTELAEAIRLEPLNPESYHNRAVIFEIQGKKAAAIEEYRRALKYSPRYEASQAALKRLGVSGPATPSRNEGEARAVALCNEASEFARRGDYPAAMRRLDEAERLAPKLSLVHQYRANVAYLAGDTPRAIAALEKGLVLDPNNALFRENLKRLRTATANGQSSPKR